MNFIDGEVEYGDGAAALRAPRASTSRSPTTGSTRQARSRAPRVFGIRPEHVGLNSGESWPFSAQVAVEIVEPMGSDTLVWTQLGKQNFTFRVASERTPEVGDTVDGRLRSDERARCSTPRRENGSRPLSTTIGLPSARHRRKGMRMNWSFQLYSARNFQPWDKVLKLLGEAGYKEVEGLRRRLCRSRPACARSSTRTGFPCRPAISPSTRWRPISTARRKIADALGIKT